MPCAVNAYSLKITAPGELTVELIMALEVMGEWNATHCLEQRQVLLPLLSKGERNSIPADLMIAFFGPLQSVTDEEDTETVRELEKQVGAGKPALIFFSEARTHLREVEPCRREKLEDLRVRFADRAVVDSYADEKEFRAKFARHLQGVTESHPHFQENTATEARANEAGQGESAEAPAGLSEYARHLLCAACEDFEGYLGRTKQGGVLKIQVNGRQLVDPGDPAAAERWDVALQELCSRKLVRDAGCNGQLFQISAEGFALLRQLGKTPCGYIAELGCM